MADIQITAGQTRGGIINFKSDFEPNTVVWASEDDNIATVERDQRDETKFTVNGITPGTTRIMVGAYSASHDGQRGEWQAPVFSVEVKEPNTVFEVDFVFDKDAAGDQGALAE